MYKAVIFDLDGTLLDSLGDILHVLNHTLVKFGIREVTRTQAQNYIGNGARELVRLAIGSENQDRLDEILNYYREKYGASDNKLSSLYEGERQAVKKLKEHNVKLAVLSNKPHNATLRANGLFFKEFAFDCVCGQREGVALKPAPDAAFDIIEKLGVDKRECVIVGDGETDVKTAENAGIDCISVLWGYRTKEQLADGKAVCGQF